MIDASIVNQISKIKDLCQGNPDTAALITTGYLNLVFHYVSVKNVPATTAYQQAWTDFQGGLSFLVAQLGQQSKAA